MAFDPNNPCIFCGNLPKEQLLDQNDLARLYMDTNPVSKGHSLAVPIRHVADYFDMTLEEHTAIQKILLKRREELMAEDPTIEGFNVGVNCGRVSGQSVFHVHVHLIPRRVGDHPDPKGGVRHVIPEKAKY
ncbi:HIT family protein [Magnetococcales bacterium HHB-1]